VTLSGFAGGEYLPLPASKGLAFPFLLTLDGYPTSSANLAHGQRCSLETQETPILTKLTFILDLLLWDFGLIMTFRCTMDFVGVEADGRLFVRNDDNGFCPEGFPQLQNAGGGR